MKKSRIQLQPGFVLHARAYRDTSQIVEVLTPDYGRVGLVARGIRTARSKLKGVLQVFRPLLFSWSKSGELGTLTGAEPAGPAIGLQGDCLLCGLYLNELIVRLERPVTGSMDGTAITRGVVLIAWPTLWFCICQTISSLLQLK